MKTVRSQTVKSSVFMLSKHQAPKEAPVIWQFLGTGIFSIKFDCLNSALFLTVSLQPFEFIFKFHRFQQGRCGICLLSDEAAVVQDVRISGILLRKWVSVIVSLVSVKKVFPSTNWGYHILNLGSCISLCWQIARGTKWINWVTKYIRYTIELFQFNKSFLSNWWGLLLSQLRIHSNLIKCTNWITYQVKWINVDHMCRYFLQRVWHWEIKLALLPIGCAWALHSTWRRGRLLAWALGNWVLNQCTNPLSLALLQFP